MQLIALGNKELMSPWEVIDGALARMKPKRDQAWLAQQLGLGAQAITNWKKRGVPRSRYEDLAGILRLSMEQVAGKAPAPWESVGGEWPFPDISRARWVRLDTRQRFEIELRVRDMVEKFEAEQLSGKSSGSAPNAGTRRSG